MHEPPAFLHSIAARLPECCSSFKHLGVCPGASDAVIGGTMSFVKGYTSDLWAALFPSADVIIHGRGADEE